VAALQKVARHGHAHVSKADEGDFQGEILRGKPGAGARTPSLPHERRAIEEVVDWKPVGLSRSRSPIWTINLETLKKRLHRDTIRLSVQANYAYDELNRLVEIEYPDETVTFTFDTCTNGIGRLCSISDKTGTTDLAP
jgi:hypothetical protein